MFGLSISVSGAVQRRQSQPMNQYSSITRSPQRCQEILLQGANEMAQSATAQMAAAQNLAAGASDPLNQQVRYSRSHDFRRLGSSNVVFVDGDNF